MTLFGYTLPPPHRQQSFSLIDINLQTYDSIGTAWINAPSDKGTPPPLRTGGFRREALIVMVNTRAVRSMRKHGRTVPTPQYNLLAGLTLT